MIVLTNNQGGRWFIPENETDAIAAALATGAWQVETLAPAPVEPAGQAEAQQQEKRNKVVTRRKRA